MLEIERMIRSRTAIEIVPYSQISESFMSSIIPKDWYFDFRRFIYLNQYKSYFHAYVINYYKKAVGFGNLLCFGNRAWVGNLIIEKTFQGIGLGSLLLQHLIEVGKRKGVKTFNLVSTSIGITLYQKFGFGPECRYCFYEPPHNCKKQIINTKISRAINDDIHSILKLDKSITGENREEFIRSHLSGIQVIRNKDNSLSGFYIEDLGDGLILADEPSSGIELIAKKAQSQNNRIVIPESNHIARDYLELNSFSYRTSLIRMRLGKKYKWKPDYVYSRGAGYCG